LRTHPAEQRTSLSVPSHLDPGSNGTQESDLPKEKHSSSKTSTDAGRMISTKPVLKNVCFAIRDNFDPDSNVTLTQEFNR
jgi:hypothetical protein